jgi:hypothetical protein
MVTAEQVLSRLNALRQEYSDDKEDETYLALHHAFLFLSYQMGAFKQYLQEAQKKDKKSE